MKLSEAQREFSLTFAKFVLKSYRKGYEITLGEAWRTPEQAEIYAKKGIGIKSSVHRKRLAVDINLFVNGQLTWDVEHYRVLGELWKTMHPLARWGGDFKGRDAVHFSFEWRGVK